MSDKKTNKKIEIYTTNNCPYCDKAKILFQRKGINYIEIKVDNESSKEEMMQRTNGAKSVPQIFVDDIFLAGGCDGLFEREHKGELDKILGLTE